jgi:hypothetical protein
LGKLQYYTGIYEAVLVLLKKDRKLLGNSGGVETAEKIRE